MKRGSLVFCFILIGIVLLSLSLVSASWFSDLWGKITGNVVSNFTTGGDNWCNGADINRDGKVDRNDQNAFMFAYLHNNQTNPTACEEYVVQNNLSQEYKEYCTRADANKDGKVDRNDLNVIISAYLTGSVCVAPIQAVCTDSDGGLNPNVFGLINFKMGSFESQHEDACALISSYDTNGTPGGWQSVTSCSGKNCYIEEAFCRTDENGNYIDADADQLIKCPYGCQDGACLCQANKCDDGSIPTCGLKDNECICSTCPAVPTCTDSDGGRNKYVKGIANDGVVEKIDSCYNSTKLREYFCVDVKLDSNNIGDEGYNCANGCKDGACNEPQGTCKELIKKVDNPSDFYDLYGNKYSSNWADNSKGWYWVDGEQKNTTTYSAAWNLQQGNSYSYIDYSITVFDDVSVDAKKILEQQNYYNLCTTEQLDVGGENQIVYVCKYISQQDSENYKYLRILWANKNVIAQIGYSEGRQLTQEEVTQMNQRQGLKFIEQLKNNYYNWVDLYMNYPFRDIVNGDLKLCSSELKMQVNPETNETCSSCWNCKVEPIICPEHGYQQQTCIDSCCNQPAKQQQLYCNPGICSGCYVPRWFESSDNTCIPYGFRFSFDRASEKIKIPINELIEEAEELNVSIEITPESVLKIKFNSEFPVLFTANGELYGEAGDSAEVYAGSNYNIEFKDNEHMEKYKILVKTIHYSINSDEQYIEIVFGENFNAYCDIDGQIWRQKIKDYDGNWASCQNSYECDSNLCSGGECVEINDMLKQASGLKALGVKVLCRLAAIFGIESSYEQCVANYLGLPTPTPATFGGGGTVKPSS